jgi:hypothetical protein
MEAGRSVSVAAKENKTIIELKQIVMEHVRDYPELYNILNVGITRPMQATLHHPNWGTAFGMAERRPTPERVMRIVTELQNKYDCIWPK